MKLERSRSSALGRATQYRRRPGFVKIASLGNIKTTQAIQVFIRWL